MSVKCPECGLKYRGVPSIDKLTPEKVERHNAGNSHQGRVGKPKK